MNIFRIPVRWERLQHAQFSSFESTELARLDEIVNYIMGKRAYVILDPHNYAFEVHQYMDNNFSGNSDLCVSETIGAEKLNGNIVGIKAQDPLQPETGYRRVPRYLPFQDTKMPPGDQFYPRR